MRDLRMFRSFELNGVFVPDPPLSWRMAWYLMSRYASSHRSLYNECFAAHRRRRMRNTSQEAMSRGSE